MMTNAVKQQRVAEHILELIGNTPMVRLRRIVESRMATILAKLEAFNPGGSVKDRIAQAMIEDAETRGLLKPGATIVEPTSGNTGIGLAMIGAVKGYHVILTMPEDSTVTERMSILKSYGAEVVFTPTKEGMLGAVKRAEELVRQRPGAFMPHQFKNPVNPQVHRQTTAQEILRATDGACEAVVAGIGTGGTITGVGEVLKRKNPRLRVVGVEPKGSPVLSGGKPGHHMIQGIGAGFVPEVLNRSILDELITVSDEDAYDTAKRLAEEEGLFVGLSSGAACWAALKVARDLGTGKTVVVVFPDTGERYLSLHPFFHD